MKSPIAYLREHLVGEIVNQQMRQRKINPNPAWGKHPIVLIKNLSINNNNIVTTKRIPQGAEPAGTPSQCRLTQRQRILVVEDDDDIRRLNTEALACSGYKVDAATDGAAAWDVLQFNSYDLLVTDYNMPRMSGVELLQKLHAARMTLPVIMVSGTIPTEKLKRHPWLQIDATLLKPYAPDELLATVRKVLHSIDGIAGQAVTLPVRHDEPADQSLQR
jgi:CheY-like chemotaxis protein